MKYRTVEQLMERYGYSREAAEKEVQRATCEHDFGDMCRSSFMGCYRTCIKCGQMIGLGRNCWERTAAGKPEKG